MIDEIVLLLQQQQEEIKKLLNQHNREIVALLIEMKEEKKMIKYDDGVEIRGGGEQITMEWLEVSARIAQQLSAATGMSMVDTSENMVRLFEKAVKYLEDEK